MKNKLAIYLSVLAMVFLVSSCSNDETENPGSPYAYIKSFSIGNISSKYPAFTETGKDTLVFKTIAGSSCSFEIDQALGNIYNNDSLPFSTNLSKVVVNMTLEGAAMIYDEESDAYKYFAFEDSLDFTAPRKFRVMSLDGNYSKYYTISINAHQVEPELMSWSQLSKGVALNPEKAVEFDGRIYVFGRLATKEPVFVASGTGKDVVWSRSISMKNLPSTADFSSLHLFGGALYVVADGDLYKSEDAENWTPVMQGYGFVAIVGASELEGVMWLASSDNIYRTEDGENIEVVGALPVDFPLYGISTSSYALSHNKNIIRNMLIGYPTAAKDGNPEVWSKLSNEESWVRFENTDNSYPCPALERLAVVRYDNFLYALGGNGMVCDKAVGAFNSFYISKDNGIVWKAPTGFYQQLPSDLKGKNIPFATFVDSNNYMWIITADDNVGVWRGIINRLGFKK